MNLTDALKAVVLVVAAGGGAIAASTPAYAQIGGEPMRIIVPAAAGGPTDTFARIIADRLGPELGRTVIVENKSGAGATIAVSEVAGAEPDGNTIGIISSTTAAAESLYQTLPYDLASDIAPIGLYAWMYNVLIVNPSLETASVDDLIARLQQEPGSIAYGSGGNGSAAHLTAELFKIRTQTDMTHVPYRGAAPAVAAVVSNEVQVMFASAGSAVPQVTSGGVVGLAVTAEERVAELPDVPTLSEAGFDFDVRDWIGVIVPTGTPQEAADELHSAISRIVTDPEVRERLAGISVLAAQEPLGPDEFAHHLWGDVDKWGTVIAEAGVTLN